MPKARPQGIDPKPMQEHKENLGLTQPGFNFNLGPSSPKHNKAQGVKKTKGGSLRKIKEHREVPETKKKQGSKETQF